MRRERHKASRPKTSETKKVTFKDDDLRSHSGSSGDMTSRALSLLLASSLNGITVAQSASHSGQGIGKGAAQGGSHHDPAGLRCMARMAPTGIEGHAGVLHRSHEPGGTGDGGYDQDQPWKLQRQ